MRGAAGRRRKQLLVTLRKGQGTAVLKSSHQTTFTGEHVVEESMVLS